MQPKFLAVKEIAARWRMSERFVRRLIWNKTLKGTTFGRRVCVAVAEVEQYESRQSAAQ